MRESTELVRCFAKQGIRMTVRNVGSNSENPDGMNDDD